MSMGHVHVIDDDEAVRDSLSALLEAAGLPVAAYASAAGFLDVLAEAAPGCVVTDVRMPEISGLDLLRTLAGHPGRFAVIVLTGEADVPMAVEALKGGAYDFIEKPYETDVILSGVQGALARVAAAADLTAQRQDNAERIASLSMREREVLDRLMAGLANKEIARDLGISHRTVEAYRAKLMIKMEVDSLPALVQAALQVEADS
jgi:two-component system response regulator FixJ